MFKHLLSFAAAACMTLSASAGVLWQSEDEGGVLVDWGKPCVALSAEEAVAAIAPGDYLEMTISGVDPENSWPQVALFPVYGGWPPLQNSGVGGQTYPLVVSFPVTNELYATIKAEGISFSGNGAYVSKVEAVSSGVEVGPFTVWFGNKACGWGNGVSLPASLFADVEANGMLSFYTSDQSFQILLGGWSGLNLPSYAVNDIPNMEYADGVTTVTLIEEYAQDAVYEEGKDAINVFDLMKANGVVMHGTTTITRIDYVPGKYINEYNADVESIHQLATAYQELVSEIAETFPGYAVVKADELAALNATIEALNDKVNAAWEAFPETGVYVGLTGAEVTEANETLIGLMAGQEELINAITEEYEADVESVNALATALQEFNNQVAEEFPGYAVLHADEIAALTATVEALNTKVTGALDAAFNTGVYEGLTGAEVTEANETLMGLVADEEATLVAITEEYDADVENVNALAVALQGFNTQVAEEFPGYAVLHADEIAALTATVEALNNKVNAAMEAAYETGVYEGLTGAEVTEANETLMGLVADEEATLVAIIEEYEADVESVNALATALQEFNTQVAEEFPGYAVLHADEFAALTATVEALNNKVNAAMEAAFETGVYEGLTGAEVTEANETLMGLVADEEATLVAITEEYEADVESVNALAVAFQELNTQVAEDFPGYAVVKAEEFAAMNATIEALNNKVNAAMEAAFETGVYEGLTGAEVTEANEALIALVAGEEELLNELDAQLEADVDQLMELLDVIEFFEYDNEYPAFYANNEDAIIAAYYSLYTIYFEIEEAAGTAFETGVYEGPTTQEFMEATYQVMGLMAQRDEQYAAITNGIEEDNATLDAYYEKIADVIEAVGNDDEPSYQVALIILEKITTLREAVNNEAVEALTETGVYNSPITATDIVVLDALMDAYTTGISSIAADANGAVYYDLNGQMIKNPATGKVYIKVVDGNASKVLVK